MNTIDLNTWHNRFGHANIEMLCHMAGHESVRSLKINKEKGETCATCKIAKTNRISFKPLNNRTTKTILEQIYMDCCGPFPVPLHGGARLSIVDDFSRKIFLYPIKRKSEAFATFSQFISVVERQTGTRVRSVRTDNGTEFCSREFENLFKTQGIRHELTNTYTPEQNSVCERYNLTVMNMVRSMLTEAGLPDVW